MASPFECEVRFIIEDIRAFEKRLGELRAELVYPYEFSDYYFKPVNGSWNLLEKNLRIREWKSPKNPTTVYLCRNEIISANGLQFKRSLYPEGKLAVFTGSMDACTSLLKELGFEFWFAIRKEKASFWNMPQHGFKTVTEYIEGLGWSGELEFEGNDTDKAGLQIEKSLDVLEIPREAATYKPVSMMFLEKHGTQ